MRVIYLAAILWACFPIQACADEAIPAKTMAALKSATVFIKVQSEGVQVSGSGFVTKVTGDSALIVTNNHVVAPKVEVTVPGGPRTPRTPPRIRRPRTIPVSPPASTSPRTMLVTLKNASVTVVFDSGTKNEREVKADVVAVDPAHDLAVVRVSGVKKLPAPLDLSKAPELTETMPVFTLGFPFGKSLSTTKGGPAITIARAAISSLRQDDNGELVVVQIDGNLNPGNSGGPVVDASGRLVGVAVAIIRDSNGIAFAVPGADVRKMMLGRLGAYHLVRKDAGNNKANVEVELGIIDPLNKITKVTLHYLPAGQARGNVEQIETLEAQPGSRKIELAIEKQLASGKVVVDRSATDKEWLLQARYVNGTGKEVKTRVVRHQFTAATAGPVVREKPGAAETAVSKDGHTKILGGFNHPEFKDVAPDDGLLIGFEVGLTDRPTVCAIRPIFRTAKGEVMGKQAGKNPRKLVTVKAKADYAVAGITAKVGALIDGFSVTFMRVTKAGLDPSDSYKSEWIGGKGGFREVELGGQGTPVIGIIGKANDRECTGLGLCLKTGSSGKK